MYKTATYKIKFCKNKRKSILTCPTSESSRHKLVKIQHELLEKHKKLKDAFNIFRTQC